MPGLCPNVKLYYFVTSILFRKQDREALILREAELEDDRGEPARVGLVDHLERDEMLLPYQLETSCTKSVKGNDDLYALCAEQNDK